MENKIAIPKGKKVFFASDNHLGAPNFNESKIRESHFLKWLNYVDKEVGALFLLGDLFDFWYEYKTVVPKGFVRVLGKIAEISDRGIPVHFFVGNHDQWMINYFEEELGIKVYYQTREFQIEGKTFFIGHGDGLGPNDIGYKIMKKIQNLLMSLKTVIIQEKNGNIQKSHFSILNSLYKLIPYTRDIYGGMGERELSYWMLFIWNYHFPVPVAQCIYKMLLPIENNPPFGSWRDIKALCGVIRICYPTLL